MDETEFSALEATISGKHAIDTNIEPSIMPRSEDSFVAAYCGYYILTEGYIGGHSNWIYATIRLHKVFIKSMVKVLHTSSGPS